VTLGEVLALRPPEGSDAATIARAIRHAETRRAELLTLDDKALQRRALACIDALLPRVRLDLEQALHADSTSRMEGLRRG
jgi:hypothetical protein